jgi:hypothetical protein
LLQSLALGSIVITLALGTAAHSVNLTTTSANGVALGLVMCSIGVYMAVGTIFAANVWYNRKKIDLFFFFFFSLLV